MKEPGKVLFYSYHSADQQLYEQLSTALRPLLRATGLCEQRILAGEVILHERQRILQSATCILLLLSASYLACCDEEMQEILQLWQQERVHILPILLRPCDLESVPSLPTLHLLPGNGRAVTLWENRDLAWHTIVREIRQTLASHPTPPATRSLSEPEDHQRASAQGRGAHRRANSPGLAFSRRTQTALIVTGLILLLLLPGASLYIALTGGRATPRQATVQTTTLPSGALVKVARSRSRFVAVGEHGTIFTSPDGSTWTPTMSHTTRALYGVAWLDSRFVVAGEAGTILTSPDGIAWTLRTSRTLQDLHGIAWSGSGFVVVGTDGTILTSADGMRWTSQRSQTQNTLFDVTWSHSQFLAVGWPDTILSSPDGTRWTAHTQVGPAQNLWGVTCSGSWCVVVGRDGTIFISSDGSTWTPRPSGTSHDLLGVIWSGSRFVAVGMAGTILTSPNGSTWTAMNSGTAQPLWGISGSGSQFVAVGGADTILISP
jgi:hypothetical protein